MTEPTPPAATVSGARAILSPRLQKIALLGCIGLVAAAWSTVLLATILFDVAGPMKLALVVGAAVVTELVLWLGATILGLRAFQKLRALMRPRRAADA